MNHRIPSVLLSTASSVIFAAGVVLTAAAPAAAGGGSTYLGGVNMQRACETQNHGRGLRAVALDRRDAFSWRCLSRWGGWGGWHHGRDGRGDGNGRGDDHRDGRGDGRGDGRHGWGHGNGHQIRIDINRACSSQYGWKARAGLRNVRDAYSWYCYR